MRKLGLQIALFAAVVAIFGALLYAHEGRIEWRAPRLAPFHLVLGIALVSLHALLLSMMWWIVLRAHGLRHSAVTAFRNYYFSDLGKYVPGKIWILAGKALLTVRAGAPVPVAISAATLELLLVVLSGSLVSGYYLVLRAGKDIPYAGGSGALVVVIACLVIAVHPKIRQGAFALFAKLTRSPPAATEISGARTLALVCGYVAMWFLAGWSYDEFLGGIYGGARPGIVDMTGIVALATLAGFLAIVVPAGIGVREGVIVVALIQTLPLQVAVMFAIYMRILETAIQAIFTLVAVQALYRGDVGPGKPAPAPRGAAAGPTEK